jgi:hypothetical protein
MWNIQSYCRCNGLRHFALRCIGITEPEHGFGDVRAVPLNCHVAPLVVAGLSDVSLTAQPTLHPRYLYCGFSELWHNWSWLVSAEHRPTARKDRGRPQRCSRLTLQSRLVDSLALIEKPTFCPHSVIMCSIWSSQQTMMTSLGSIKRLVLVMESLLLFCVVGASFYKYYLMNVRGLREVLRRLSSCSLLLLCLSTLLSNTAVRQHNQHI